MSGKGFIRSSSRRFVEDIAWVNSVWIENEPKDIVYFERIND